MRNASAELAPNLDNGQNLRTRTKKTALAGLMLGAIGVVFGDIGTSPLYALHAVFGQYGLNLDVTQTNVYGIISLIIWAVTLTVSIKYIGFIMRADNKGEGGIMALVAQIKNERSPVRFKGFYIILGLIGIALFYGDSTITPAISVLSAVEGLKVLNGNFDMLIVPATLVLLSFLFWVQRYGTAAIGKVFGPVMLVWFMVIGLAGAVRTLQHPGILHALSPLSALHFAAGQPLVAFLSLGVVILAVTGAEALYADMGHFGRRPIARGWFMLVFPTLMLCYMGQGATVLADSSTLHSPFMALFPQPLQLAVIILATAATLIASQSVISGAFSLTRQAIQLDFLPKMHVIHTSIKERGQIYLPAVNLTLFVGVVLLVVIFGSSARLAGVYGIAVSGTLAIDTLLFLVVARTLWRKPRWYIALAAAVFVTTDALFVLANLTKIPGGGWLPLVLSAGALIVLHTWYKGQAIVTAERRAKEGSLQGFIDKIRKSDPPITRVPGAAVYIGHHSALAPLALHAAVEKLHELHERVVILSVRITTAAHVPEDKRAVFNDLSYDDGISQLKLSFGYHDTPNIPHELERLQGTQPELDFNLDTLSYFISLSKVVPGNRHNLAGWRKVLYSMMSRNALSTSDYYKLPIERTIEMRSLIEL